METNSERRRRKLTILCEERGLKNVAYRAQVSAASLDQIIKGVLLPAKKDGSRSPRALGDEAARRIEEAEVLGRGWFDEPDGANTLPTNSDRQTDGIGVYTDNASVLTVAGSVPRGRLVPVVGTARLGDNGFYEEISSVPGSGDGLVDAYSSDPNAFALRVKGDSMFPAIRDGWYVVVEPNSAPQPGDYVLIKLKSGQRMVKELLMQRPDSITVSSVNGDVRKTIDSGDIDGHYGVQSVAAIVSPKKWRPE